NVSIRVTGELCLVCGSAENVELSLVDNEYGWIRMNTVGSEFDFSPFCHTVCAEPAVLWFKLTGTPIKLGLISFRGKKIMHAFVSAPDRTFTPHSFALLEIGHRIVAPQHHIELSGMLRFRLLFREDDHAVGSAKVDGIEWRFFECAGKVRRCSYDYDCNSSRSQ